MKFKQKYKVYKIGSIKGTVIPNEKYTPSVFYYVRVVINGETKYLCLDSSEDEFTDLTNATYLPEIAAVAHVNRLNKITGINASLFVSSKK